MLIKNIYYAFIFTYFPWHLVIANSCTSPIYPLTCSTEQSIDLPLSIRQVSLWKRAFLICLQWSAICALNIPIQIEVCNKVHRILRFFLFICVLQLKATTLSALLSLRATLTSRRKWASGKWPEQGKGLGKKSGCSSGSGSGNNNGSATNEVTYVRFFFCFGGTY